MLIEYERFQIRLLDLRVGAHFSLPVRLLSESLILYILHDTTRLQKLLIATEAIKHLLKVKSKVHRDSLYPPQDECADCGWSAVCSAKWVVQQ